MKTAKLHAAEQNNGIGVHLCEGMGDTQSIERAVTTHESDVGSLHTCRQTQLVDQEQIDTR